MQPPAPETRHRARSPGAGRGDRADRVGARRRRRARRGQDRPGRRRQRPGKGSPGRSRPAEEKPPMEKPAQAAHEPTQAAPESPEGSASAETAEEFSSSRENLRPAAPKPIRSSSGGLRRFVILVSALAAVGRPGRRAPRGSCATGRKTSPNSPRRPEGRPKRGKIDERVGEAAPARSPRLRPSARRRSRRPERSDRLPRRPADPGAVRAGRRQDLCRRRDLAAGFGQSRAKPATGAGHPRRHRGPRRCTSRSR